MPSNNQESEFKELLRSADQAVKVDSVKLTKSLSNLRARRKRIRSGVSLALVPLLSLVAILIVNLTSPNGLSTGTANKDQVAKSIGDLEIPTSQFDLDAVNKSLNSLINPKLAIESNLMESPEHLNLESQLASLEIRKNELEREFEAQRQLQSRNQWLTVREVSSRMLSAAR